MSLMVRRRNVLLAVGLILVFADGSHDMGTFAVEHNPGFGQTPPPEPD